MRALLHESETRAIAPLTWRFLVGAEGLADSVRREMAITDSPCRGMWHDRWLEVRVAREQVKNGPAQLLSSLRGC